MSLESSCLRCETSYDQSSLRLSLQAAGLDCPWNWELGGNKGIYYIEIIWGYIGTTGNIWGRHGAYDP